MLPAQFTPVLRLPRNTLGRDFIVGDIHGRLDLLRAALDEAKFDPSVDRLLSPGDLVDRGPYSLECAKLLDWDCVFSSRGNHEHMALESFNPDGSLAIDEAGLPAWLNNGMGWWLAIPPAGRVELLKRFARLPVVIEVETSRGLIGIVHADVPPDQSWSQFTKNVEALDPHTIMTALWGRQRIQAGSRVGVSGVGRVFVGHTPQWMGLRRYGNVYAMDTGAVYGRSPERPNAGLSVANVLTGTAAMTQPQESVTLWNVVDAPAPEGRLFGQGPGYTTHDSLNWLTTWRKKA